MTGHGDKFKPFASVEEYMQWRSDRGLDIQELIRNYSRWVKIFEDTK